MSQDHLSKSNSEKKPTAVLVSVQLSQTTDDEHQSSLAELERLVHTLGFEVLGTVSQKRQKIETGTVLGAGKLKELARLTGGKGVVESLAPKANKKSSDDDHERFPTLEELAADAEGDEPADEESSNPGVPPKRLAEKVVFDGDLTPTQIRNMESATDAEVLDRTGVIVEIFHRHARTREARLQVEIARLRYLAPRLRATRTGERQGGGIGAKGVGETAHELDSRRIRDRIAELQRELEIVHKDESGRRKRRSDQARVALVGYTNAGKSSLMRALTGSEVLVEDKLFATLDTTIRTMQPPSVPRVLISDTVGFIKKLPHDLVASFRSTLDEAGDAGLQLHVVDGSDAGFRAQLAVTHAVLAEIGANAVSSMLVLNKMDLLSDIERRALKVEFPDAVQISTRSSEDVTHLRTKILAFFEDKMVQAQLMVPYTKGQLIGEVHRVMQVLEEQHDEQGTHLHVRALPEDLEKVQKQLRGETSDV